MKTATTWTHVTEWKAAWTASAQKDLLPLAETEISTPHVGKNVMTAEMKPTTVAQPFASPKSLNAKQTKHAMMEIRAQTMSATRQMVSTSASTPTTQTSVMMETSVRYPTDV